MGVTPPAPREPKTAKIISRKLSFTTLNISQCFTPSFSTIKSFSF